MASRASTAGQPDRVDRTAGAQRVQDLTGDLTAERLARRLVGKRIEISNVTFVGSPFGAGTFEGFQNEFGIESGVALSSGSIAGNAAAGFVSNVLGPNDAEDVSAALGAAGDPDLDALVAERTLDASVLEFDFLPDRRKVSLRYVFGSEEYLEFVGEDYADVVAVFVNGRNCAVVPDPDGGRNRVPVTIHTVNDQVNPELFVSNSLADQPPAPHNTELDGFTTVLRCTAQVQRGEHSHLKIAIADTADSEYDSTVLLRARSFH